MPWSHAQRRPTGAVPMARAEQRRREADRAGDTLATPSILDCQTARTIHTCQLAERPNSKRAGMQRCQGPTLAAALKIFPAKNIFVIANGNSPTPLDNTEEICQQYGVNHVWSPVGSKM